MYIYFIVYFCRNSALLRSNCINIGISLSQFEPSAKQVLTPALYFTHRYEIDFDLLRKKTKKCISHYIELFL